MTVKTMKQLINDLPDHTKIIGWKWGKNGAEHYLLNPAFGKHPKKTLLICIDVQIPVKD